MNIAIKGIEEGNILKVNSILWDSNSEIYNGIDQSGYIKINLTTLPPKVNAGQKYVMYYKLGEKEVYYEIEKSASEEEKTLLLINEIELIKIQNKTLQNAVDQLIMDSLTF